MSATAVSPPVPGALRRSQRAFITRVRSNRFRALWAPIILLEIYLTGTVLVFFLGPVHWYVPSATKLVFFLIVNFGALGLGYSWGIKPAKRVLMRPGAGDVGIIRMPRQILWLLVASMAFSIVSNLLRLSALRGGLASVFDTLLNPGGAYFEQKLLGQLSQEGGSTVTPVAGFAWAFRISTFFAVFNSIYLPLGLICWRQLSTKLKLMFFAALFSAILFGIGLGAQSGIGFLVFASLPVALYKLYVAGKPIRAVDILRNTRNIARRGLNPIFVRLLLVLMAAGLVATVVFFQVDRADQSGRGFDPVATLAGPFGESNPRSVVPITGGRTNFGLVMGMMYMSHGYEGLALAMEMPFQWTYGLGWSRAMQILLRDYFGGPDLFDKTYLARSGEVTGWPPMRWWGTLFPWIASDTTFYGTALVMVLVGFIIGRCWGVAIVTGNPVAFVVLGHMFILIFMIPANNAIAQSLDGLFSLIGVWVIYRLSRKYFKSPRLATAR